MKQMIVVALLFLSSRVWAQDVYNFYFQKAPGPQTVEQGGNNTAGVPADTPVTATIEPGAAEATLTTTPPPLAAKAAIKEYREWAIYAGMGSSEDPTQRSGRTIIGGEYYFSKWWGLNAQFLLGRRDNMNTSSDMPSPEVAIGGQITPIRLTFFDWELIDFSILGGVMTAREGSTFTYYDGGYNYQSDSRLTLVPYIGIGLGLNFTKNIALLAQFRRGDNRDNFQGWGALAYRF